MEIHGSLGTSIGRGKKAVLDSDSTTGTITDDLNTRMNWSNTYEFLFTCLLYVVGLGNIVRFPGLAYTNGGGAFLVPYLISVVFIGIPIFYLEVAFGQYASLGPITIWKVSPIFKGIGYGVVVSSLLVALTYNLTISWAIYYFFISMQKLLPWSYCQPDYPDDGCRGLTFPQDLTTTPYTTANDTHYATVSGNSTTSVPTQEITAMTIASVGQTTSSNITHSNDTLNTVNITSNSSETFIQPSEQYFYREFLMMSDGIEEFGYPHWKLSLCLMLAWIVVFVILTKGVKSAGRTAVILTPFPYITLLAFLIQSCIVDNQGALEGIKYFVTPRWEHLGDLNVWYEAVTQVFFSLSLMQGGLITLASYNKFHHNIYRAAVLIPVLDTLTSIFAAFTVFSVLGVMANKQGVDVKDVLRGSTGTAFITFTEAISMMPVPQLWSVLFFFMLICLGMGTQYVLIETCVTAIMDEYPERLAKRRLHVIAAICGVLFVLGVPLTCPGGVYLSAIIDKFSSSYATILLAIVFNIALAWVYGVPRLSRDIKAMLSKDLSLWWKILWKGLTPLLLLVILIFSFVSYTPLKVETYFTVYIFPVWSRVLGWAVFTALIAPLFFCAGKAYLSSPVGSIKKKIRNISSPTMLWGPALEVHRLELMTSSSSEDITGGSRRVYDKARSPDDESDFTDSRPVSRLSESASNELGIKTGKDIGGLDSIFSATVGNNVLVKMAMDAANSSPARNPVRKESSMSMLKEIAPSSADMLAKRLDNSSGGPIMFIEDGETYMLVPKRKNRPPSVDKSTQTSPYKRKDNSQIDMESSLTNQSSTTNIFTVELTTGEENSHSNAAMVVDDNDNGIIMHCVPSLADESINPTIVIENTLSEIKT